MGAEPPRRDDRRAPSRAEAEPFHSVELTDAPKPAILRAYLKRWKAEVGVFFGGVGPDASDEELLRIGPDHPVFRITIGRHDPPRETGTRRRVAPSRPRAAVGGAS